MPDQLPIVLDLSIETGTPKQPIPKQEDTDQNFFWLGKKDSHGETGAYVFEEDTPVLCVEGMSVFKPYHPETFKPPHHEVLFYAAVWDNKKQRTLWPIGRHHSHTGDTVRMWFLPGGVFVVPAGGILGLWGNGWMQAEARGWPFGGNAFETTLHAFVPGNAKVKPYRP